MSEVDNTKYFDLSQMIFLIGNSPEDTMYEKHKFMVSLFFLKNPIFLEKLCNLHAPKKSESLEIKEYERYNLLYEEERISMWNSKNDLLLAYLVGRELVNVELNDTGYCFKLTDKGSQLFNILKNDELFKIENIRAKIFQSIVGKKNFNQIKEAIIEKFPELSL